MADPERRIKVLRHLTLNWPGEPMAADGLIRVLNAKGRQPPLIWCCNAQSEYEQAADLLGPDQPVIGLRSLHMIEDLVRGRPGKDRALGDFYANALLAMPGLETCVIGGNCQAAPVAERIAARFLLGGRRVLGLISIDAEPALPLPVRVGFIFGDQSAPVNPYLRGIDPQPRWNALFAGHSAQILPGGLSAHFLPAGLQGIGAALRRLLDDFGAPAMVRDLGSAVLNLVGAPPLLCAGSQVQVQVQVALPQPVRLGYVWISDDHAAVPGPLPQMTGLAGPAVIDLQVPDRPGMWDLHLYACHPGGGPLGWHENQAPKLRVQVTGAERSDAGPVP